MVSLEQAVAAPYCGLLLANSGARVIKVERPEGDFARGYDAGANGQSAIFAWLNRGKESVCLDLKSSDDMQLMKNMLIQADVFLSNLAPGSTTRMGLDQDTFNRNNPRLITCSISGYGENGAAAKKKAYDFLVQAESGICAVTGTAEEHAKVGISLADLSTGLTAYSAILRALIQRGITGRGAALSVSMFDVMADWMNMPVHRKGLACSTVLLRLMELSNAKVERRSSCRYKATENGRSSVQIFWGSQSLSVIHVLRIIQIAIEIKMN